MAIDSNMAGTRLDFQLSLLDIGAVLLGFGWIGAWTNAWAAISWVGAALVIRYLVPRGGV